MACFQQSDVKTNFGTRFSNLNHCELMVNKRTSPQWCVFNNYSLDKHRHQIWHHFYFSFKNWNNKLALNFATIHQFSKILVLFWKNNFSYFQKDIPKVHTFFISKVLEVYFDLCLFFSWIDINFAFQKALAEFLLVRAWPFL